MMFETFDTSLINSFANDPDILPWCGFPAGTQRVDVTSRVGDDDILFVTDGDGAMICFNQTEEGWEFHSMFRKSCRGRKAISAANAMFDWLAREVDARLLIGICPIDNRAVRWFCRQLGMRSDGFSESEDFGPVESFRKELTCH